MSLSYSFRDAKCWAAFSGDHNPIHFDTVEAKRLGMNELCVHGMRAMLDVKYALSTSLEKYAPSSDWLMFTSRLREPVLCEIPYQLPLSETVRHERVQVSGNLLNTHTRQISISSKLAGAKPLVLSPFTLVDTFEEEELTKLYTQFLEVKSHAAPQWSFLDAVLFRQLVNDQATLDCLHSIFPVHEAASLCDVFSLLQVVQTHHETHFSHQLLMSPGKSHQFETFDYAIQPTLVMGQKKIGLVLLAGIQAWRENEPMMSVTITLKTGPLVEK